MATVSLEHIEIAILLKFPFAGSADASTMDNLDIGSLEEKPRGHNNERDHANRPTPVRPSLFGDRNDSPAVRCHPGIGMGRPLPL